MGVYGFHARSRIGVLIPSWIGVAASRSMLNKNSTKLGGNTSYIIFKQQNNSNKPPGSLIGVIYGCNGVREGCIGVSLPIPYRDESLVEHVN